MVSFDQIPSNLLVPGFFAEIHANTSGLGPAIQEYQILVIGQLLPAGTQAALDPVVATSHAEVGKLFGRGSMIHGMARTLFLNNRFTKATFVGLADASGTPASSTLVVTGPSTAAGTIALYVAGYRVTVAVASGDAVGTIRTAIVTAINTLLDAPMTAAAGTGAGDIDVTARNDGTVGNDLDVRHSYMEGEELPAGVTLTTPALTSGATDPDISTVWAVLGETQYNVIASPFTDSANLTALNTELEDRWGAMRAIEGVAFLAKQDTHANLLTFGDGQKTRRLFSVMGYASAPTPPYEWAAALAGLAAGSAQNDPARPFQTLALAGVSGPSAVDRFDLTERNLLLIDGVATFKVDGAGVVRVERCVSTWQEDPATSSPSIVFRDIQTALTLGYLRFDLRTRFLQRYPRHKLGNDGTLYGPGQAILTPKGAKAEVVAIARGWEQLGLIEDLASFKDNLTVERSATDPNRLDLVLPPDIINQFRVGATRIDFLL